MKPKRPIIVLFACALLLLQTLSAFLGLAHSFRQMDSDDSPISMSMRQGFAIFHVVVITLLLTLVFRGKNRGRVGYSIWGAIAIAYALVLVNFQVLAILPAIGFYVFILLLLFTPSSNAYFRNT